MRSDYYDPVAAGELRPLPPLPQPPRRKRHALPLFLLFLALILAGGIGLFFCFGWPGQQSAFEPGPSPAASNGEPESRPTTIRTLPPPGEGSLTLLTDPGEAMTPKDIYTALSPSILAVTARDTRGGGSQGTGVIFDTEGYFVTNAHVIEGTDSVEVTLSDGRRFPAFLIGMDERTDLAVLKFAARGLTAAPFASDATLSVGDPAYAIGNPLGSRFQGSMTDGIISGIDRNVTVGGYAMSLIQTSAAINTGSSGGALVDGAGRVVGITNMKMMSWYSTVEGLGFAIPSGTVEKIVNELMVSGHIAGRPMLGITVRPAAPEESGVSGLLAEIVDPASDAWAKGIRPGFVLTTANGVPLRVNQDLLDQKEGLSAGDSIILAWYDPKTGSWGEAAVLLVEEYELG